MTLVTFILIALAQRKLIDSLLGQGSFILVEGCYCWLLPQTADACAERNKHGTFFAASLRKEEKKLPLLNTVVSLTSACAHMT